MAMHAFGLYYKTLSINSTQIQPLKHLLILGMPANVRSSKHPGQMVIIVSVYSRNILFLQLLKSEDALKILLKWRCISFLKGKLEGNISSSAGLVDFQIVLENDYLAIKYISPERNSQQSVLLLLLCILAFHHSTYMILRVVPCF